VDLYLVRHAEALDAERGQCDADRPLSEEGRRKMARGALGLHKFLSERGARIDGVLSSPLFRARETARILAREVLGEEKLEECPPLGGEFQWADLIPHLERHPSSASLALVGHEPHLGNLAGWLVAGSGAARIPLKKGSIICFEVSAAVPRPQAVLLWFLAPRQLRMLA
jgi:phosphohistidine phosphatase